MLFAPTTAYLVPISRAPGPRGRHRVCRGPTGLAELARLAETWHSLERGAARRAGHEPLTELFLAARRPRQPCGRPAPCRPLPPSFAWSPSSCGGVRCTQTDTVPVLRSRWATGEHGQSRPGRWPTLDSAGTASIGLIAGRSRSCRSRTARRRASRCRRRRGRPARQPVHRSGVRLAVCTRWRRRAASE
jgi:hypothetical protein